MATPSMARKNQIAKGIAANMPAIAAMLNSSCPDQPPLTKFASENPGLTTPMNTSSSKIAKRVTISSNVAAIPTPRMFTVMKMT